MNELLAQVHYSIILLGPEMLIVYFFFLVLFYTVVDVWKLGTGALSVEVVNMNELLAQVH